MAAMMKQQQEALANMAQASQAAITAAAQNLFQQHKPPEPKPTERPPSERPPDGISALVAQRPASPSVQSLSNASSLTAGSSQGAPSLMQYQQQRLAELEAQQVYDEECMRQRQVAQAAEIAKLRWHSAGRFSVVTAYRHYVASCMPGAVPVSHVVPDYPHTLLYVLV